MSAKHGAIAALLCLCACGGGGNTPTPPPSVLNGWAQFFGSIGITAPSFDFPPPPGSVHYVVGPGKSQLGQTVTMVFSISGSGTWGISDPHDTLPPHVRLFLWERGDNLSGQGVFETYREWCGGVDITEPGQYTLTCKLDPTQWTGVFGQTPSAAAFQQMLGNLYGVGYTFGGAYFAGHGVYSATGSFHFDLIGYVIQ